MFSAAPTTATENTRPFPAATMHGERGRRGVLDRRRPGRLRTPARPRRPHGGRPRRPRCLRSAPGGSGVKASLFAMGLAASTRVRSRHHGFPSARGEWHSGKSQTRPRAYLRARADWPRIQATPRSRQPLPGRRQRVPGTTAAYARNAAYRVAAADERFRPVPVIVPVINAPSVT